jgi:hypothetical protein
MRTVEILYFDSCPTWRRAEQDVRSILSEANVEANVQLVPVTTDDEARQRRFLGSPTVRVDGLDVEPSSRSSETFGLQCRLYEGSSGTQRVPDAHLIRVALGIEGNGP